MRSSICVSFDLHNSIYTFLGARDLEFWKFCLADSLLYTLCERETMQSMSYHMPTPRKWKRDEKDIITLLLVRWKTSACSEKHEQKLRDPVLVKRRMTASVKRKVLLQEGNKLEVPRCLKIKASRNNRTILTLDMMTSWTEHERRRRRRGMRKATGDSTCHSLTQEAAPSEEPNEIQLPIARRTIDDAQLTII